MTVKTGDSGHDSPLDVLQDLAAEGARQADPAEVAEVDQRLEQLLQQVSDRTEKPGEAAAASPAPAALQALAGVVMRTAYPTGVAGRRVRLRCRGSEGEVEATLAPEVDRQLIEEAVRQRSAVVIECGPGDTPLVVGVLQTRIPEQINLKASKIHIDAADELLLRSGRAAMRLRGDGDVELVGSRISTMSRGLYRLIGRVLRLN